MDNSGTILWKNETVGRVTNIMFDMWYVNADWKHTHSDISLTFVNLASRLKGEEVMKDPFNGMVAWLSYDEAPSTYHPVLIFSMDNSKLFMRSISDELAAYVDQQLLEPWQTTGDAAFYETALKKEVSFFHPLNWKKVRAIAHRTDCDDVLFEVLTGKRKYAVVHLTWRKESSRKFPITKFYKDWQDVYVNCIAEDHKLWKAGQ